MRDGGNWVCFRRHWHLGTHYSPPWVAVGPQALALAAAQEALVQAEPQGRAVQEVAAARSPAAQAGALAPPELLVLSL